MSDLDRLEEQSVYILREAYASVAPMVMLWSLGKDSCVMLWLARKAFLGHVPFRVVHIDTGYEFPEVYQFRDEITEAWDLPLEVYPAAPIEQVDSTLTPGARFAARKMQGLMNMVSERQLRGVIAGIRRDEQAVRAKERVFSPRDSEGNWDFRDQPAEMFDQFTTDCPPGSHLRIHPLLAWSERDIWRYIKRENIPVVPLYFAKNGQRFRSLGEVGITEPIESRADTVDAIIAELDADKRPERAGRTFDHESEDTFERLRAQGYL
jgi:sulfate adenylyltransferase subunit 2